MEAEDGTLFLTELSGYAIAFAPKHFASRMLMAMVPDRLIFLMFYGTCSEGQVETLRAIRLYELRNIC